MNDSPIAFFDSGVGGLPYLSWIREKLPLETLIYLADTAHFPYGERSEIDIQRIVLSAVEQLILSVRPKLIVVACNTASVITLAALRQRFQLPFVGVVPAIKPAAKKSQKGVIGLLATSQTVAHAYTDGLINDFASDCKVLKIAAKDMVDYVEHQLIYHGRDQRENFIKRALFNVTPNNIDAVILGCTHFIHLEKEIAAFFGKHISLIDSRMGVGNQIIKILDEKKMFAIKKREDVFFTTGGIENKTYRNFAKKFHLTYKGSILPTNRKKMSKTN